MAKIGDVVNYGYTPREYEPSSIGGITSILDQIISRYQPGGAFGKAALSTLEQRKGKTIAKQKQSLVSSGLGGTTIGAGLGSKFEQEVGTPFRLGVEEQRIGALTQAMQAKAGFMERESAKRQSFEESEQQRKYQSRITYGGATVQQRPVAPSGRSYSGSVSQGSGNRTDSYGGGLSSYGQGRVVGGGGAGGGSNAPIGEIWMPTPDGGGTSKYKWNPETNEYEPYLSKKNPKSTPSQQGPPPGYVDVGTPGYPSYVQASMWK